MVVPHSKIVFQPLGSLRWPLVLGRRFTALWIDRCSKQTCLMAMDHWIRSEPMRYNILTPWSSCTVFPILGFAFLPLDARWTRRLLTDLKISPERVQTRTGLSVNRATSSADDGARRFVEDDCRAKLVNVYDGPHTR